MLATQAPIIVALIKGAGQVQFIENDSEVPAGCVTESATADVIVHIPAKGKVDAAAEIKKLEGKKQIAEQGREKIVKNTQAPNYETVIPENVRAQNVEKVSYLVSMKLTIRWPSSTRTLRLSLRPWSDSRSSSKLINCWASRCYDACIHTLYQVASVSMAPSESIQKTVPSAWYLSDDQYSHLDDMSVEINLLPLLGRDKRIPHQTKCAPPSVD